MKVSKERCAQNRERILEVAAKLFRERGFDGVGVADIMHEAGLTHGGFYGHFESKDDLIAQATAHAMARSRERSKARAANAPNAPLSAITDYYLSDEHRFDPGGGCLIAALGADIPRQAAPVRQNFTEGLRASISLWSDLIKGESDAEKRQKAIATYCSLVGALILARAVDDPEFADEILQAVGTSVSDVDARTG